MSPLTMTVEQERKYRAVCSSGGTEVDPVFAEVDALRAALAEESELRTRLGDLLTLTVNALKGEPDSRSLHDWATLPEVARKLVAALADERKRRAECEQAIHEHFVANHDGAYECEHGQRCDLPCEEAGEDCSLATVRRIIARRAAEKEEGR